jgi:hypothetical protein
LLGRITAFLYISMSKSASEARLLTLSVISSRYSSSSRHALSYP